MTRVSYNVVLLHPEIPQNTGGIGRLCVATETRLHLIQPLGFSLDDKYVRRAGMDYWRHLDLSIYQGWDDFLERNAHARLFFFSTRGKRSFWDTEYDNGCYLVFGRESSGFPPSFYARYADLMRLIPMEGSFHRSLNLANSVAIALFEALRQANAKSMQTDTATRKST